MLRRWSAIPSNFELPNCTIHLATRLPNSACWKQSTCKITVPLFAQISPFCAQLPLLLFGTSLATARNWLRSYFNGFNIPPTILSPVIHGHRSHSNTSSPHNHVSSLMLHVAISTATSATPRSRQFRPTNHCRISFSLHSWLISAGYLPAYMAVSPCFAITSRRKLVYHHTLNL